MVRARRAGKDGLAVLDELEAAEAAYEQQHAPLSPRQRSLAAAAGGGAGGAATSPRQAQRAQQAQHIIGAETRLRVVEKLAASLAANSVFAAGRSPQALIQAAQQCEQALFEGSHSK